MVGVDAVAGRNIEALQVRGFAVGNGDLSPIRFEAIISAWHDEMKSTDILTRHSGGSMQP